MVLAPLTATEPVLAVAGVAMQTLDQNGAPSARAGATQAHTTGAATTGTVTTSDKLLVKLKFAVDAVDLSLRTLFCELFENCW